MSQTEAVTHYTVGDIAKAANVSPTTVRRWLDGAQLTCTWTVGGVRLFRRDDVEAFLERRREGGRE